MLDEFDWGADYSALPEHDRCAGPASNDAGPTREAQGIEGRPVIWLKISTDGVVAEVRLHKSCGHKILDDAALRYVKSLKFIPARRGDTPIEWEAIKPVNYFLE